MKCTLKIGTPALKVEPLWTCDDPVILIRGEWAEIVELFSMLTFVITNSSTSQSSCVVAE
jgi:hypothetical protein